MSGPAQTPAAPGPGRNAEAPPGLFPAFATEGAPPSATHPTDPPPAPPPPHGAPAPRPGPRDDADAKRPRFLRRRRAETLSGLLPLAAFFALMPPFVTIFAHDGRIFGAPSALVFLLGLWLGLVIAVRMLSRRLLNPDRDL